MKKITRNVNYKKVVLDVIERYVGKKITGTRMFDQGEIIHYQIISMVERDIRERVLRVITTNTRNASLIELRDRAYKLTPRSSLRRDGSNRRNMRF